MLEELEKHMDSNAKQVLKNMEFVDKSERSFQHYRQNIGG